MVPWSHDDHKSPKWGCGIFLDPFQMAFFMVCKWWVILTTYLGCSSRQSALGLGYARHGILYRPWMFQFSIGKYILKESMFHCCVSSPEFSMQSLSILVLVFAYSISWYFHVFYSGFCQPMVNWWFGLVVWIPRIPLWKGLLLRGTPQNPKPPTQTTNYSIGVSASLNWW